MVAMAGRQQSSDMPPGLHNLGETCFFNAMLQVSIVCMSSVRLPLGRPNTAWGATQALASSHPILAYLQRTVHAAGPSASELAVALLEVVTDLTPGPGSRTVSPGPVLHELRCELCMASQTSIGGLMHTMQKQARI